MLETERAKHPNDFDVRFELSFHLYRMSILHYGAMSPVWLHNKNMAKNLRQEARPTLKQCARFCIAATRNAQLHKPLLHSLICFV